MTQAWLGTDVSGDGLMYEGVHCLACSQQHFVCVATGHVLGDKGAAAPAVRSPAFPPKQVQQCHDRAIVRRVADRNVAMAVAAARADPPKLH
jgi:hypothetical protein